MGLFGLFNKKSKENPAEKREKAMKEFAEASLMMEGKVEDSNLSDEDKVNAKAHLEIIMASSAAVDTALMALKARRL